MTPFRGPFASVRRMLRPVAASLLLLFGAAHAIAAWHGSRGPERDTAALVSAELATAAAAGHTHDGCALCSTAVHPPLRAVVTVTPAGAPQRASFPPPVFLAPLAHTELGASGPRAPPVG